MLIITLKFALLENVMTSLSDEVDFVRKHKLKFCVGLGAFCFCLGLPICTRGGQYIFEIMDYYGGSIPLIFIAIFEAIAIMWVYGYKKFAFDVHYMLDKQLGIYWKITWKYTSPIILSFIFMYSLFNHKPLSYGDYDYPAWADVLGWILTLIIILQIPFWAIFAYLKQKKGDNWKEV